MCKVGHVDKQLHMYFLFTKPWIVRTDRKSSNQDIHLTITEWNLEPDLRFGNATILQDRLLPPL